MIAKLIHTQTSKVEVHAASLKRNPKLGNAKLNFGTRKPKDSIKSSSELVFADLQFIVMKFEICSPRLENIKQNKVEYRWNIHLEEEEREAVRSAALPTGRLYRPALPYHLPTFLLDEQRFPPALG